MSRFSGKVAVVTGASSGMGRDIARALCAEGASVIAVARRQNRLEELAEKCEGMEGKIIPFVADLMNDDENHKMIEFAVEQCGKLDILVNNAGMMDEMKPVAEIDSELYDRVMTLNAKSPMLATQSAVLQMEKQETGGNIVNVASIGGTNGCKAGAIYTMSKHALVGLSKNTAFMYVGKNIRCNVVCPGGVKTEVGINMTAPSQLGIERVMAGVDTSIRQAEVEEISPLVLFLASDAASFITGAVVTADGGVTSA
uniref:SDR family oxidoreductase n=1 Tax=Vaginimicrobium propionicum TaxID=1871034 RepID=UPI0009703666|nr:SDR family NAD(P)-dependent oxidoreductase [Vaginimicrobium propionicum]